MNKTTKADQAEANHESNSILTGLSLLTIIQIRNNSEHIESVSVRADNEKYSGALIIPPYGRILVSTDATFDCREDAKGHMDKVVEACKEYMAKTQIEGDS